MASTATNTNLVRINIDADDEIKRLNGVGPELAARIVQHREEHGVFRGPSDLENVSGVGPALVHSLIPQIDWSLPDTQPKRTDRDWFGAALFVFLIILPSLWLQKGIHSLRNNLLDSDSPELLSIAIWVIEPLSFLPFVFAFSMFALSSFVTSPLLDKRLYRTGQYLVLLAFLLFVVKGLLWATRNTTNDEWVAVLSNPVNMRAVQLFFIGAWTLGPVGLLLVNWRLAANTTLEKIHTTGCIVQIPLILFFSLFWGSDTTFGVVELVHRVVLAGLGLWTGMIILNGGVPYREIARSCGIADDSAPRYLEIWIDRALPSIEDQEQLRDLLHARYPRSFARTFGAAVVLGASGWLLLTVIGGAIEWFTGNVLDRVFGP